MVLGKGGRKAKRKWDSGWFLSRGGIFLKKESTVGLLNGAFFCFFRGGMEVEEDWEERKL
ncbi:hypothetical protein MNL13_06265 [Bartonella krasnovii]|uniref:Uncharacterized protein n=1 Tax=Bartonella krasnovii TaxID=2267275 RepID=A0ABY3VZ49_9HYPH|nr:hypothetical protein [Bartonella krasnovii]UNF28812.1 hypothetical protein MNL13_06265 [Bartonella krasnovii]